MEGISGSPPGPGMGGAPRVVHRPPSTRCLRHAVAPRPFSLHSNTCIMYKKTGLVRHITLLRITQLHNARLVPLHDSQCASLMPMPRTPQGLAASHALATQHPPSPCSLHLELANPGPIPIPIPIPSPGLGRGLDPGHGARGRGLGLRFACRSLGGLL